MDIAMWIFCIIGCLMFLAYLFFLYKTSYDDQKEKKRQDALDKMESMHKNGSV
jgi:hypothetical protein